MKRICVFAGASSGNKKEYSDAAIELGNELVLNNIELVYGGGRTGLMGAIADSVIEKGGNVIGVIPKALFNKEATHENLTETFIVDTMHERKAKMHELSDAFITLPGGYGTLEETLEMLTWAQLGLHDKPCGLLNVGQYYDPLLEYFDHIEQHQFIDNKDTTLLVVEQCPDRLLRKLMK